MTRYIFTILLAAIGYVSAFAATISQMTLDAMGIKDSLILKSLVMDSVIPYDSTHAIVAIPVKVDSARNVYDLYVAKVKCADGSVVCYVKDDSKIDVGRKRKYTSRRFDFAKFKLNDNVMAFGIRMTDSIGSDVYISKNEYMTLYAPDKNKLLKVLDNLLISSVNDQWNLQNCEGDHFTENKIVVMSRKKKKGNTYRDLIIKNRVVSVKNFINHAGADSTKADSTALKDVPSTGQEAKIVSKAVVKYKDGDVVTQGSMNNLYMHDKMNNIDSVNVDSIAKKLETEKLSKNSLSGEELDDYLLEHVEEDEDCVETTTIEWMHEYYVFKNGNYVLTAE
ncbi:MAG: hypothetical protein UH850_06900 [Paludibacteraceae bacterium]|nr:hypothetical protein [Paludibacteraceae bacterium]